jgi:hypothetical protein
MKTKLTILLLAVNCTAMAQLITVVTNHPSAILTVSSDANFNPRLNVNGQQVFPVATNLFASTVVFSSRTNAPTFTEIGSVTNRIFLWASNSVPPTVYGSYYNAATNLQTKWTQ